MTEQAPQPPGLTKRGLPNGLIRRSQFRHLIPYATNTLAAMIKRGAFPAPDPRVSSERLYIWSASVIEDWLDGTWVAPVAADPVVHLFPADKAAKARRVRR